MGLPEVRHREVVEVGLLAEHAHPLVVDGEERRQVVEGVGGPHLLDGAVWKLQPVSRGELELELGLEGAFEMQVQLRLRHVLDKAGQPVSRLSALGSTAHAGELTAQATGHRFAD